MSLIEKMLSERGVPDALIMNSGKRVSTVAEFEQRREEIKKILEEEEYGVMPPTPDHVNVNVTSTFENFAAGKAIHYSLEAVCTVGENTFSFPFSAVIPTKGDNLPAFVHLNFRPNVPDRYMPSEEIVDRGYAVFSFCYNDVTLDKEEFRSGVAKYLKGNRRKKNAPGKIAMWAWAAMRVMDYIETLPRIDKNNVAVVGHSRLGKTALVAGGFDERFKYIISNDSGCSGAAISRGKIGESVVRIAETLPRWFCPRYIENATKFETRGYDQNFLLTLSVPRHIMIGSAEEDLWSDPESEFLCAASVNEAYALFGLSGLVHNDEIPKPKCELGDGEVLYQLRHGTHYFSREDWLSYMDYIDKFVK